MRLMRRFYLFCAFIIILSACSDNKGSLEYIESNQTLIVITDDDFVPFAYIRNGESAGVDIEIIRAIAADLGVNAEFRAVNFNLILSQIDGGNAAIGAG